jgi:hypothetical protein
MERVKEEHHKEYLEQCHVVTNKPTIALVKMNSLE